MSERAPSQEQARRPESAAIQAERPAVAEYGESQHAERVQAAERVVAAESSSTPMQPLPVTDDRPYLIDHAVKRLRMKQNLASVQSHLSAGQQRLSRIIHQPTISIVSDGAARTVSRPSGLLGGGIVAFIGSIVYLVAAHRLGFTYNFSMFLVLFVLGFALGVSGEFLGHWLRRRGLAARR